MNPIKRTIERNVRRAMQARGLRNSPELARVCGISRGVAYQVLTPDNRPDVVPSTDTLVRVADGLRVPVWTLFLPPEYAERMSDSTGLRQLYELLDLYSLADDAGRALLLHLARHDLARGKERPDPH